MGPTYAVPGLFQCMPTSKQEVLSAPILYHEYEKLIEEVSNRRFLWGLNDYGGMDMNGDGKITLNEIGESLFQILKCEQKTESF